MSDSQDFRPEAKLPDSPVSIYDEWLTTEGAAIYLNLSVVYLKQARTSGILCGRKAPPFRKVGRKAMYRYEDLANWVNQFPVQTVLSSVDQEADQAA